MRVNVKFRTADNTRDELKSAEVTVMATMFAMTVSGKG